MTQVVWRARRQPADTTDSDLYDVQPVKDTVNRFANEATLLFDDPDGTKKASYPRGTRVECEVSTDGGSTFTRRFAGSVQDTGEASDGAADRVEVSIVGYNHWLRARRVEETYSSQTLSAIIEDVIKNYTPVTWNASNVSVQNDKTVSWDVNGQKADTIIDRVASASADEDYYVNDDFEFVFEQRETNRAGSDIVDGDWVRYNLPEEGSGAVNRVDLFYGQSGSRARVTVEDRAAQRDLKDKLGASSNVVISEEVTFERISSESEAEDKAREILNRRSQVLTGTVTTFGRFDMEAGDVFHLEISEKGIDTDFRVAQIEYYWARDETVVTVAENTGDVQDLLVQLADDVKKVDLRAADFTATANRFLDLPVGVTVEPKAGFSEVQLDDDAFTFGIDSSASYFGFGSPDPGLGFRRSTNQVNGVKVVTYPDARLIMGVGGEASSQSTLGFGQEAYGLSGEKTTTTSATKRLACTTAFLNQLRDVWQGESPTTITHAGLGTGTEDAVSTDTDLDAEVTRVSIPTPEEQSARVMQFTARIEGTGGYTSSGITELGFFDAASGGDMYLSGVIDSINPSRRDIVLLRIEVTVANDSELFGVVTTTGQERLVDLFLGGSGHEPSDLAFGTGTGDASEADTSLGNKVIEKSVSTADRSRGKTDVEATLGTGEANSNDLSELGLENSSDELLTRVVYEAIAKTSSFELSGNNITGARNA